MRAEERKPPGNRKTESRVFDADLAQEAVAGSGWAKHTPVDIHVLMKIRKLRVFSLVDPANSGFPLSRNLSCSHPARTAIT